MSGVSIAIIVALVVVIGLVVLYFLPGITGTARAMQVMNGPVRGTWRGLPMPVPEDEVVDVTDAPVTPPPPPGTHVAVITASGMKARLLAQWFRVNLQRQAFTLDDTLTTDAPGTCVRTFRAPDGGIVQVVIAEERQPYPRTNTFIVDGRGISPEAFIAASQPAD